MYQRFFAFLTPALLYFYFIKKGAGAEVRGKKVQTYAEASACEAELLFKTDPENGSGKRIRKAESRLSVMGLIKKPAVGRF